MGKTHAEQEQRGPTEHEFNTLNEVEAEMLRAAHRYGPFTSTHEALGVLIEEMDELRAAIRANILPAIGREARQVAAVAARLAAQCAEDADAFRERSSK